MKRTYDPRKVKRHRSYTVESLAKLYGVSPNTVRQWIKKHGLPTIPDTYPVLMHWREIRDWLTKRQANRKWTCGSDEMSCFTCKGPRKIRRGTLEIIQNNTTKVMLRGDCVDCDRRLNRASSTAKLEQDLANFRQ